MGFFKDFKEDLSQAVNELTDDASKLAAGDSQEINDDVMVDTLSEAEAPEADVAPTDAEPDIEQILADTVNEELEEEKAVTKEPSKAEFTPEAKAESMSDETAIITPGLKITGDIESNGSIELLGEVDGNVTCHGKLVVSGSIKGDSSASEFFADKANITGAVNCNGPAKIGTGSVIVGNLSATSAVIAGAIKGDIDVHGPVIVDTTAIVMGNIKSKLVQINNGAVIEGYCSQCYSDNSPKKFFNEK